MELAKTACRSLIWLLVLLPWQLWSRRADELSRSDVTFQGLMNLMYLFVAIVLMQFIFFAWLIWAAVTIGYWIGWL